MHCAGVSLFMSRLVMKERSSITGGFHLDDRRSLTPDLPVVAFHAVAQLVDPAELSVHHLGLVADLLGLGDPPARRGASVP